MSKERINNFESGERLSNTVINVENLSLSKGLNQILDSVSFKVQEGEHLAIVGQNGAGKTTLLEVLVGIEGKDSGHVWITKGNSIAYVPQSIEKVFLTNQEKTVIDFFYLSKGLDKVKYRMNKIEDQMKDQSQFNIDLLNEYGTLLEVYESNGGYTLERDIHLILNGLGLNQLDLSSKIIDLSGGEKTKLFLAQTLLSNADILFLDEPSNHLDQNSINWLGEYLQHYKGTILIVSHHPKLLNKVSTNVIELKNKKIKKYYGNYTYYIDQKKVSEAIEIKKNKEEEEEIERLSEMINRFRAGVRAKTSKDRQKKLEKIIHDRPEIKDNKKNIRAIFEIERQSGVVVLEIQNLKKIYHNKVLDYSNINFKIERSEKVGIVGPIGSGKSTLLKMIAGNIQSDYGKIKFGYNVDLGYYSQEMEDLNPENTVLEEIETVAYGTKETSRTFLGSFLFTGDDVYKKVAVLSYGEKSRLMLAKLSLKKYNFLVLDEPSNHLDVITKNLLAEKLKNYKGTLLLVSHDREFMDKIGLTRVVNL